MEGGDIRGEGVRGDGVMRGGKELRGGGKLRERGRKVEKGKKGGRRGVGDERERKGKKKKIIIIKIKNLVSCHQIV